MGDDGLVEALAAPACPLCAHVARIAPAYLDSMLYQHTADRAYRDRFLAGGGFCARHVRAALVADTAGNGDGVGGSIFLRSQLAARRRALGEAHGFRAARKIRSATRPAWNCPVCENEQTLTGAAAGRLVVLAGADPVWHEAIATARWCLTHLGDLLAAAAAAGSPALDDVRERQLAQIRDVEQRLEALAHDSSHDRRPRVTPDMRASVGEAADILAGDEKP